MLVVVLNSYRYHPVQEATAARLADAHSSLRASLVSLWARFAGDSEEVAAEWLAWLRRADQSLLEALTACVRRSLHEVARALQGEHKSAELSPVFVLGVILDTNGRCAGGGEREGSCMVGGLTRSSLLRLRPRRSRSRR